MKKNKTMAYGLAATLLVGGTFLGTKALFMDKVNVAGELAISTGDVDIEVTDNKWYLDRNGVEYSDGTSVEIKRVHGEDLTGELPESDKNIPTTGMFANNLKPGDRMYKAFIVENKGTLVADVTLGENFTENTAAEGEEPVLVNKLGVLEGLVTPSQTVIVDTNNSGKFGDTVDGVTDQSVSSVEDVEFRLLPGQKAQINLELEVGNLTVDDYHNSAAGLEEGADKADFNDDDVEDEVINLNNAWTLDAVQQNPGHSEHQSVTEQ